MELGASGDLNGDCPVDSFILWIIRETAVFSDPHSNKINPHNLEISVDKTNLTMTNPVKLVMKVQCVTENWGCGKFLDE